jgi:hypothetical protein
MSTDQGLAFAVIAGTMALLIWGRLRYDLVALAALLAAVACGSTKRSAASATTSSSSLARHWSSVRRSAAPA